jgi:response regulator RpfG family c-di-GMP phosphodiesterase
MNNNYGILVFIERGMDQELINTLLDAEEFKVYFTSLPLEAIHILLHKDIDVALVPTRLEGMEAQEFKQLVEKIKPGVSIFRIPSHTYKSGNQNCNESELPVNLHEFFDFIQNHIRAKNIWQAKMSEFKDFLFTLTNRLLQILEARDNHSFNSNHRVAYFSHRVALTMGLDSALVDSIQLAALLRDIGKIGIQQEILTGKGILETDSINRIRCHPLYSLQLLKDIQFPWNVEEVIHHHHEYYDGNGYPDGLKGKSIPVGSRIIALVDAYVAMTTKRPYREAFSEAKAVREIISKAGSQFDPEVVEVFLSLLKEHKDQPPHKKRVLIVDADDSVSTYIRLNLDAVEFDVFIAASTVEALTYLENNNPQLIIADWGMLKKDGFNFYNTTRQSTVIPFIIMVSSEEVDDQPSEERVNSIVKPIDIDILHTKLRSMLAEDPHSGVKNVLENVSQGVSGTLQEMGITDILQILNMGMKTARVILQRKKDSGEIFLVNGNIVHAILDNLTGKEALFEVIGWDWGNFCILHGQTTDTISVTTETGPLLLEAAITIDERRHEAKMKNTPISK